MTGRQPRNVNGELLTHKGTLDQRAHNLGRPKAGPPMYFVRYKPGDARPWHVMRRAEDGTDRVMRVTRHETEQLAVAKKDKLNGY